MQERDESLRLPDIDILYRTVRTEARPATEFDIVQHCNVDWLDLGRDIPTYSYTISVEKIGVVPYIERK